MYILKERAIGIEPMTHRKCCGICLTQDTIMIALPTERRPLYLRVTEYKTRLKDPIRVDGFEPSNFRNNTKILTTCKFAVNVSLMGTTGFEPVYTASISNNIADNILYKILLFDDFGHSSTSPMKS